MATMELPEEAVLDQIRSDREWLLDNYVKLADKYEGKIVAIHKRKILCAEESFEAVDERLRRLGLDLNSVVLEVIPRKGIAFIL